MKTAAHSFVDRVRRPEYTGENRCLPCTVVNACIALGLSSLVAVVATPVAGGLVLGTSLAAIWLRGYLVPGTPELTRRYLPDTVLRLFGKAPDLPEPGETVDVEAYLLEVGAVRDGGVDVELAPSFARDWQTEIDAVKADTAAAAGEVLSLDAPDVEPRGDATVVTEDGLAVANWPSEAALVADVAAVRVLEDRDPSWPDREHVERGRILAGLRIFLETCPACGATPRLGEDTVESCCRRAQVFTYTCPDCEARLLEVEQ